MKKYLLFILIFAVLSLMGNVEAQSLPSGTCGIVFTYDAAGNRTKREFILNNSPLAVENVAINGNKVAANDILKVDALYPNPTTGQFNVRLVKPLQNATVMLVDMSGRVVFKRTESGSMLSYNISSQPTGVYLLQIIQNEEKITMKVLKK